MNLPEDEKLTELLRMGSYKKNFIPDYLSLVKDYARTEDDTVQKKIHALLVEISNYSTSRTSIGKTGGFHFKTP